MLKKLVFIDVLHLQYRINSLDLYTFSNVIINITKFPLGVLQNLLRAKGFQAIGSLFLLLKISIY